MPNYDDFDLDINKTTTNSDAPTPRGTILACIVTPSLVSLSAGVVSEAVGSYLNECATFPTNGNSCGNTCDCPPPPPQYTQQFSCNNTDRVCCV